MSDSFGAWPLVAYWLGWLAALLLPAFLYRGQRKFEAWEIYAAHPRYARLLRLYPYVTGTFGVALVACVLYVATRPGEVPPFLVHLAGLLYGGYLVADASFALHTGIRSVPAPGRRLFALEEEPTWRSRLQLRISFAYCAAALAFLLGAA